MIKSWVLLASTAFYSLFSFAGALPQALNAPGGVVHIPLGATVDHLPPQVYFNNHRALVTQDGQQWLALVGMPLDATIGQHHVTVKKGQGTTTLPFNIVYKQYPEQYLTIQNKRMVNPNAEDMRRINADLKLINKAIGTWTEQAEVDTHFIAPVDGRISGVFGSRRFFNKQPKNPHSGLDIAAPAGTSIKAPAKATVISTGNYYYNGNCVFLDHGQGLISAYFHMTDIHVQAGQHVNQGDELGTVGATGRVTGPHLHWNIYMNSTKVDPALFIPEELARLDARNTKGERYYP